MKAPGLLPLFLLLAGFPLSTQAQRKRPNIIFILVDDQGYGDLGAFYQNQRAGLHDRSKPCESSPHLDQLAAGGAMLTQHYSAAPVCAPSRASLLLGVSQGHANVRDNQFDKVLEDNYTMAGTLRALGYSTAAIGKWGLQGVTDKEPDWPGHPQKRGFDYFFGYIRHADGHEHYPKEGLYDGPKQVWEDSVNIAGKLDKCYTADLWTAVAKKYITGHVTGKDSVKPFFLYLAYETPHAVLELPTQSYPPGGGLHGGIQWTGIPGQMINTASGKIDSWTYPSYDTATYDDDRNPGTPDIPWPGTYKRYATANRRIDDAVGDLVQLLRDLRIDSNTLIVYTSDNGPSIESYLPKQYAPNLPTFFGSYGPFDGIKRDNWEGGIRMPTIAWWPGHIPAGKVDGSPSISYDWAPTFLAAAGVPAPARMDGVSILPSLTGHGHRQPSAIYIEYYFQGKTPDFGEFGPGHRNRTRNQMQTIRVGDYIGVRYNIASARDEFEVYDVMTDPGERTNLASTHHDLQLQMQARVLQQRRPDAEAPRPYDSALLPAIKVARRLTSGIRWSAYRVATPWIPKIETLKPIASGTALVPGMVPQKAFEMRANLYYMDAYILVPADGSYQLYAPTSVRCLLRIDEATVIDHDYGDRAGKPANVRLQAGYHHFRLLYKPEDASANSPMVLEWTGPGSPRGPMAKSIFFKE